MTNQGQNPPIYSTASIPRRNYQTPVRPTRSGDFTWRASTGGGGYFRGRTALVDNLRRASTGNGNFFRAPTGNFVYPSGAVRSNTPLIDRFPNARTFQYLGGVRSNTPLVDMLPNARGSPRLFRSNTSLTEMLQNACGFPRRFHGRTARPNIGERPRVFSTMRAPPAPPAGFIPPAAEHFPYRNPRPERYHPYCPGVWQHAYIYIPQNPGGHMATEFPTYLIRNERPLTSHRAFASHDGDTRFRYCPCGYNTHDRLCPCWYPNYPPSSISERLDGNNGVCVDSCPHEQEPLLNAGTDEHFNDDNGEQQEPRTDMDTHEQPDVNVPQFQEQQVPTADLELDEQFESSTECFPDLQGPLINQEAYDDATSNTENALPMRDPLLTTVEVLGPPKPAENLQASTGADSTRSGKVDDNNVVPPRPVIYSKNIQRNSQVINSKVAEQSQNNDHSALTDQENNQAALNQRTVYRLKVLHHERTQEATLKTPRTVNYVQETKTHPVSQSKLLCRSQAVSEVEQNIDEERRNIVTMKSTSGAVSREFQNQSDFKPIIQPRVRVVSEKKPKMEVSPRSSNVRVELIPQFVEATEVAQTSVQKPQTSLNLIPDFGEESQRDRQAVTTERSASQIRIPEGHKLHFCSKCLVIYISRYCLFKFSSGISPVPERLCTCIAELKSEQKFRYELQGLNRKEICYRLFAISRLIEYPREYDTWLQLFGACLITTGGFTVHHDCRQEGEKM